MTNETYLTVSYFCAAATGVAAAIATGLLLRGPLRRAVAHVVAPVARAVRRMLPAWLVLAALFAFTTVSYIDCEHKDYAAVIANRDHLEHVTRTQAATMLYWLCYALLAYSLGLVVVLALCTRKAPPPPAADESEEAARQPIRPPRSG